MWRDLVRLFALILVVLAVGTAAQELIDANTSVADGDDVELHLSEQTLQEAAFLAGSRPAWPAPSARAPVSDPDS